MKIGILGTGIVGQTNSASHTQCTSTLIGFIPFPHPG